MAREKAAKTERRIERLFARVPYNWSKGNRNLYNYFFPDITSGLAWLTEKYQEQSGIRCEFRNGKGRIEVDKDINFLLFESASELLSSIDEFSNPHHISVTIKKDDNRVAMSVEEDGRGPETTGERILSEYRNNHRLSELYHHLKQIGGTVDVASEKGARTCITLIVPPHASVQ